MVKVTTIEGKIEATLRMALESQTQDIHDQVKFATPQETYQLLCTQEIVRGMVTARLLAESVSNPMLADELHRLASKMQDALEHVYPTVGLAGSAAEAVEKLGKIGSVATWKIHTRILSLLKPEKRERPFPIPSWPTSAFSKAVGLIKEIEFKAA